VTGVVPAGPAAAGSFHVVGIQAVHADAARWLPVDTAVNSIGDAYSRLIAERPGSVTGFVSDAAFWDIGTVADYVNTSRALSESEPSGGSERESRRSVRIDPTARINDSILWDDITIGHDCRLDECIVTDHVTLQPEASHRRAILIQTPAGVMATPLDRT
jgi:NDP-sugar pyrophosphorylase family protein